MITQIELEKIVPEDKKRRELRRRLLGVAEWKPYSVAR